MKKNSGNRVAFSPLRVLWYVFALIGVPVLAATVLTSALVCGDPELCTDVGMGTPLFLVIGLGIGVGLLVASEVVGAIRRRNRNSDA